MRVLGSVSKQVSVGRDRTGHVNNLLATPQFAGVMDRFRSGSGTVDNVEKILQYEEPKLNRFVQSLNLFVIRRFLLKGLSVEIRKDDVKKLKAIPDNAGNILVGGHPDIADGFLINEVHRLAGKKPAGIMANTEVLAKLSFIKPLLKRAGYIPVQRGKSNQAAMDYMAEQISKGQWGGMLAEGSSHMTRTTMPMETGAIKTAIQAALQTPKRPILITPYAHVYLHADKTEMLQKMSERLTKLECLPELFGQAQAGIVQERVERLLPKVLSYRASLSGITLPAGDWLTQSAFLRKALTTHLEKQYLGAEGQGYERRRVMKVRMAIYDRISKLSEKELADVSYKASLAKDVAKTQDVVTLCTLEPEYFKKRNDLESYGELIRKMASMMEQKTGAFGGRRIVLKVTPSIDVRPIAERYQALKTEQERQQLLIETTDLIRSQVQEGIEQIHEEQKASIF